MALIAYKQIAMLAEVRVVDAGVTVPEAKVEEKADDDTLITRYVSQP